MSAYMADPFQTVTPPDLPALSQVDGSELVPVWRDGRLSKMRQQELRGTKTFSGASNPPYEASRLFALQVGLNDRWRNTATRDEFKLTGLDPITWAFDGNVGGPKGDPGAGISPKGQFATVADLPIVGLSGDLYIATADDIADPPAFLAGEGAMYVATGGTFGPGNKYRNIGPFRGPPGATTVDGLEDATAGFKAPNVEEPGAPGTSVGDRIATAATSATVEGVTDGGATGKAVLKAGTPTAALAAQAAPLYPDGPPLTWMDSAKSIININEISSSGNAADDDAAFAKALALAALTPNTSIVCTRPFFLTSEKNLPPRTRVVGWGSADSVTIRAVGPMRSMFNIDKTLGDGYGDCNAIENLTLVNNENNFGNATALIRVDKQFNNQPCQIENIRAASAFKVIDWIDGDVPIFHKIWTLNCLDTLYFRNNGMNGHIDKINTLGGRGLYIARNAAAARPQQMEGTKFHSLQLIPGGMVNGQYGTHGVEIRAGLALSFQGLLVDQVYNGAAFMLDGSDSGSAIYDIEVQSLWLGAAGENPPPNVYGLFLKGNTNLVSIDIGQIVGFSADGVHCEGSPSAGVSLDMTKVVSRLNGGVDLFSVYCTGSADRCKLLSTQSGVSVLEGPSSSWLGLGNSHAVGGTVSPSSNWLFGRGPGAPTAVPTAPGALPGPGWFWKNNGAVALT